MRQTSLAAAQPEALRQRLTAQLQELAGNAQVAPERLAQEVALLATKADVREELDRLQRPCPGRARAAFGAAKRWAASSISWRRNSTAKPIRSAPNPPTSR